MENYQIEAKIGQGVLANVYKASNKQTGRHDLVLKEVECQDFPYAKKALDEYRIFHSLNHRYICKFHDSCVNWDRKTSSAFVCYVMDFYAKGDLMNFLNDLRSKKQKITLTYLRIWMAQIVEGIDYMHQNGLIHCNLKPSSLYLRPIHNHSHHSHHHKTNTRKPSSDDEAYDLVMGDFGVATVMKDARTKTRILPGSFNYVAPEIIDGQAFTAKSDVWTMGSVLLDMCTTSIYDQKTFQSILMNIRHDDADLMENIMRDVFNVYETNDVTRVLAGTLDPNPLKRFSLKALINEDLVYDGLQMIDSDLVKKFGSNDIETTPAIIQPSSLPSESPETVLAFIRNNLANEREIQSSLEKLLLLVNNHGGEFQLISSQDNQKLTSKLMKNYANNTRIQSSLMQLLEQCLKAYTSRLIVDLVQREEREMMMTSWIDLDLLEINRRKFLASRFKLSEHFSRKLLEMFFFIFLKHDQSAEIQLDAMKVLIQLANYEDISEHLAQFEVIKHLKRDFLTFSLNANLSGYICKAIWTLSIHDSVYKSLYGQKCLKNVRNVLLNFKENRFCVEMACNVVIALCMNERLIGEEELEIDSTSAILVGLKHHLDSSTLVKSASMAFKALISFSEECAFRFLYRPPPPPLPPLHEGSNKDRQQQDVDDCCELDGIQLLAMAYAKHRDESEIVADIANVFKELCKYDEMITEMRSLRLNATLITDMQRRYRDNLVIGQTCEFIISKISAVTKSSP